MEALQQSFQSFLNFFGVHTKTQECVVGNRFQGGTEVTINGSKKYAYNFPMGQLTVDIVFYNPTDETFLFIVRGGEPYKNRLAITGGFVEIAQGEEIDDAATREAREECGEFFDPKNMRQVLTVGNATRDPRGYTCTTVYVCNTNSFAKAVAGDDARNLQIVTKKDLVDYLNGDVDMLSATDPKSDLSNVHSRVDGRSAFAFDHEQILRTLMEKGVF